MFGMVHVFKYGGTLIYRKAKGMAKLVGYNEVLLYQGSFSYILLLLG